MRIRAALVRVAVHGAHHARLAGDLFALLPLHVGEHIGSGSDPQPLFIGESQRVIGAGQSLADLADHVRGPAIAGLATGEQLVGDDGRHQEDVIRGEHLVGGGLVEEVAVLDRADACLQAVLDRSRRVGVGQHVRPDGAGDVDGGRQFLDRKLDMVQLVGG
jgi:hypothetical protein